MKTVYLRNKAMTNEEAAKLEGCLLSSDCYDLLVDEDTKVLKPDGSVLLIYRTKVIPLQTCLRAARVLRSAAKPTRNRGTAAGKIQDLDPTQAVRAGKVQYRRRLDDGTISNTREGTQVNSGTIGAFDRNTRFPYCRLTAFTLANWGQVCTDVYPFLEKASDCFRTYLPERFNTQLEHIQRTNAGYRMGQTVFTTFTANRNFQTAVHKDAGDLKQGFGVMSAVRSGEFEGLYTVFPQYRVAVSMRTGGVCLADVHEWHCNTPVVKAREGWERLSVIMYYRENMERCGSPAEELDRVKYRKGGPLWDD